MTSQTLNPWTTSVRTQQGRMRCKSGDRPKAIEKQRRRQKAPEKLVLQRQSPSPQSPIGRERPVGRSRQLIVKMVKTTRKKRKMRSVCKATTKHILTSTLTRIVE